MPNPRNQAAQQQGILAFVEQREYRVQGGVVTADDAQQLGSVVERNSRSGNKFLTVANSRKVKAFILVSEDFKAGDSIEGASFDIEDTEYNGKPSVTVFIY